MTVYAWTLGAPSAFEMRVMPNSFTFTSTYSKTTQVIDFLGERWYARIDLAGDVSRLVAGAREAFFDRLRGPVNLIALWNLRRPIPLGTMRDATVATAIPQLANTATLSALPACTARAGDHVGIGGQMVRVMADALCDATGQLVIEFLPRMRTAVAAGVPIVWNQPTANFMLKSDGVPVVWHPGMHDGVTFELVESY